MVNITGGCLCGKVRYSVNAEPTFMCVCHRRNCQKETGSAFAVVIGVPQSELSAEGELKTYTDKGDSGKAQFRRFCPECGSTVLDEAAAFPGVLFILAGTLDDPSWVRPGMQIFCDSAQPWVRLGGDMQLFLAMPG